jgi:hypothetical protein
MACAPHNRWTSCIRRTMFVVGVAISCTPRVLHGQVTPRPLRSAPKRIACARRWRQGSRASSQLAPEH